METPTKASKLKPLLYTRAHLKTYPDAGGHLLDRLVLLLISSYHFPEKDGSVVGEQALAELCGVSDRAIRISVNRLIAKKRIKKHSKKGYSGPNGRTNLYEILSVDSEKVSAEHREVVVPGVGAREAGRKGGLAKASNCQAKASNCQVSEHLEVLAPTPGTLEQAPGTLEGAPGTLEGAPGSRSFGERSIQRSFERREERREERSKTSSLSLSLSSATANQNHEIEMNKASIISSSAKHLQKTCLRTT